MAALLKAGAEVFSEKGYETATMTEIAARAGASIGSLYQFFPTKELLAKAMHEAYLADLSAMLEGLQQRSKGQSVTRLADDLFDEFMIFLAQRPAFGALAERRDIDKEQKRRSGAAMRQQIAALLLAASPSFPEARCKAVAALVLQLMKAAVALNSEEDESLRHDIQSELRQMLKGHLNSAQVA